MENKIIRFLTAGSVDDGKSTLIGRLLFDTNSVYHDQIAEVKKLSGGKIDYSLFVEGLESERRQKITIDVAYRYFSYHHNKFIIADSPGHEQYTKNMAVAASNSDIAVMLVDASEGVKTQTIRHSYISNIFGIKDFVVVINKMDLAGHSEEKFLEIKKIYLEKIESLDINSVNFIPISAINGDNVVDSGDKMDWYQGKTLLDYLIDLESFVAKRDGFRMAVQNVLTEEGTNKRFYQGTITSGEINVGDEITIYPSKKTALISEVLHSSKLVEKAEDGDSIGLVLDKEIDIDRGSVFSDAQHKPKFESEFGADLIWFGNEKFDPSESRELLIKINHNLVEARISSINHLMNIDDLSKFKSETIEQNQIAHINIKMAHSVAFDSFTKNKFSGSFLLIDKNSNETLACGLVENDATELGEKSKNSEKNILSKILVTVKKFFR
ncbi:MAG: sulfate adenylyltransferase subunit 1 [Lentimonas sp.]